MVRIYMIGNVDEKSKLEEKRGTTVYTDNEYDTNKVSKLKQDKKHVEFRTEISSVIKKQLEYIRQCDFVVAVVDSHIIKEDIMAKIVYTYQLGKQVFIVYDGKWEDLNDWTLNFTRGGIYKSIDTLMKDLK